jgi:hypothetical protein
MLKEMVHIVTTVLYGVNTSTQFNYSVVTNAKLITVFRNIIVSYISFSINHIQQS